jgi:hypothetical protein
MIDFYWDMENWIIPMPPQYARFRMTGALQFSAIASCIALPPASMQSQANPSMTECRSPSELAQLRSGVPQPFPVGQVLKLLMLRWLFLT